MNPGDIVINKNSESGEMGIFLGWRFSNDYKYASVLWPSRAGRLGSIQPNLLKKMEIELTDDQLEDVRGGMSTEKFSKWRAEVLNGR